MTSTTNLSHDNRAFPAGRLRSWTRELVELGALLVAAGAAHLFVRGVADHAAGAYALIAMGTALLAIVVAGRLWIRGSAEVEVPPPRSAPEQRSSDEGASDNPDGDVAAVDLGPADLEFPDVHDQNRALWRLRASVTDSPGRLARLASGLAELGGNIRTVQVHPVADGAVDEVLLHVPENVTSDELVRAVEQAGGRRITACRADVRELDDVPTRTLNLAKDLVNGRSEMVRALRVLLGDVDIRWQEDPEPPLAVDDVSDRVMCVPAPGGGVLVVERPEGAFTPAEFARARAMVDLGAGCRDRVRHHTEHLTTVNGVELTVRPADRDDIALVTEFHERCSSSARYQRYFSPGPGAAGNGLLRLLTPALGRSMVVQVPNGDVVALGNLMYDEDTGEIALLVRDDWQRQGIGLLLARRLVEEADALGIDTLSAQTHVDNTAIARTLRAAGLKLTGVPEPGEWCWTRTRRHKAAAAT